MIASPASSIRTLTVGPGFAPGQPRDSNQRAEGRGLRRRAVCPIFPVTASEEFHLALKQRPDTSTVWPACLAGIFPRCVRIGAADAAAPISTSDSPELCAGGRPHRGHALSGASARRERMRFDSMAATGAAAHASAAFERRSRNSSPSFSENETLPKCRLPILPETSS